MTENEKPKTDYLKWWLVFISLLSVAGLVKTLYLSIHLGSIFCAAIPLGIFLLLMLTWTCWKLEHRVYSRTLSGFLTLLVIFSFVIYALAAIID